MFDLHERRKIRRYIFSHVTLLVLFLLLVMLGFSMFGIAGKERETRDKRTELTRERDALSARAGELAREIESLRTPRGIEAELRQQFEVGAPGEKLIVIVDPEVLPEETPSLKPTGFWVWVKGWFE